MDPRALLEAASEMGVGFFAGVPDSLLKSFCACVADRVSDDHHVIAANEGGAVALAAGYHLGSGGIALVYLQNSGFGNAVNPLLSLADPEVYAIPMVLLVGWRGEPGQRDEPQHMVQGKVMEPLLSALGIPWEVVDADSPPREVMERACREAVARGGPYLLLVRAGAFDPYETRSDAQASERGQAPSAHAVVHERSIREGEILRLTREEAISLILDAMEPDAFSICTTGMASRELFELRRERGESHQRDFLMVGSMGHASQLALGLALARPDVTIYCFDGDGALLMHMGALPVIGAVAPANLRHIVLNNGAHDSVGGQPTVAMELDLPVIARGCGYPAAFRLHTQSEVEATLTGLRGKDGPIFLEILLKKGTRPTLGRPSTSSVDARKAFMASLEVPRRSDPAEEVPRIKLTKPLTPKDS